MLAHERLRVRKGAREHVGVVLSADVAEHYGGVALQPALGASYTLDREPGVGMSRTESWHGPARPEA